MTDAFTIEIDRRLALYPRTDLGAAERFVARQFGRLAWRRGIGWVWWDGRRWRQDGVTQRLQRAIEETVRAIQTEADAIEAAEPMIAEALRKWGRRCESFRLMRGLPARPCRT